MKILTKISLTVLVLILILASTVSCGFNPVEQITNKTEMTKDNALSIISKVALDYTDLELDEVKVSDKEYTKKLKLFLELDQEDFTKLMKETDLEANEVLTDSKYFFQQAATAAYFALKYSEEFEFGKVYDVDFSDNTGSSIETVDCKPVAIVDAEDGGIFILLYSESTLKSELVQMTFHLNVYENTSVLETVAVYAGEREEKGVMITDYVKFISGKTVETASIEFEFESFTRATEVAKVVTKKAKVMTEIKSNVLTLSYNYAALTDDVWVSNGVEISKEETWNAFMKDLYSAMKDRIDMFGSDFEGLFENSVEVLVPVDALEKETENEVETDINTDTDVTEPEDTSEETNIDTDGSETESTEITEPVESSVSTEESNSSDVETQLDPATSN